MVGCTGTCRETPPEASPWLHFSPWQLTTPAVAAGTSPEEEAQPWLQELGGEFAGDLQDSSLEEVGLEEATPAACLGGLWRL